jgi:prepilin-type N-terminal cleavage/methylation domain-containing protein
MKKTFLQTIKQSQAGFTLVELMVALTLFTFVILAAVSSLYAVNDASRKVSAMRGVLDNLNFAMESMSRTIRTSTDIVCGGETNPVGVTHNCPFPTGPITDRLSVHSTLGIEAQVEYRLNTTTHQVEKRTDEGSGYGEWIAITSTEINIQSLTFFVKGADVTDGDQPSVIIMMRGIATAVTGDSTPFALHTFISQRASE